ncbi:MAG: hypothetical protein C7B46_21060 [Sulfobacillus benefaciens]|uniref:Uncharacterized protein n=1 Tax=Sulfobacillus benefaciens TaxID=453960 RepID=A0A2T2WQD8_9FIRM|nr:MAG: hypothetical protein C7B46_21060 [Sulfobacillus benefaciens]
MGKPAKQIEKVEPVVILGIEVPAQYAQLVSTLQATIAAKYSAELVANAGLLKEKQEAHAQLTADLDAIQSQIAALQARRKGIMDQLGPIDSDIKRLQGSADMVDREVLTHLARITGAVEAPKVRKASGSKSGPTKPNGKYRIILDGVDMTGTSAGMSISNLAWYKFGKCGSDVLKSEINAQNPDKLLFSKEHLDAGAIEATVQGKTVRIEMISK